MAESVRGGLLMWTVYEKPSDFPEHYVARLWHGEEPQDLIMASKELERLQANFAAAGLVRMARHANDDPKIVEVWL